MATVPGIFLGKFRVDYDETRERAPGDGYLLQQRAVIRLNEALVKLEEPEDCLVYCDLENFKRKAGKGPSPLQYFIASLGVCMFSQIKRFALRARVTIEEIEMDLRMTYDLSGKFPIGNFSDAARGLQYTFAIRSAAPLEQILKVGEFADKGCHTVNSMRTRMPVVGRVILNGKDYAIGD